MTLLSARLTRELSNQIAKVLYIRYGMGWGNRRKNRAELARLVCDGKAEKEREGGGGLKRARERDSDKWISKRKLEGSREPKQPM